MQEKRPLTDSEALDAVHEMKEGKEYELILGKGINRDLENGLKITCEVFEFYGDRFDGHVTVSCEVTSEHDKEILRIEVSGLGEVKNSDGYIRSDVGVTCYAYFDEGEDDFRILSLEEIES